MTVDVSLKSDLSKYSDWELLEAYRTERSKAARAQELADYLMREMNAREREMFND